MQRTTRESLLPAAGLVVVALSLTGCYRSHALDGPADDAGVPPPRLDSGPRLERDAGPPPPPDPDLEPPAPGTTVVQLAAGYHHVCALTDDGAVYCWGRNDVGQAGGGSRRHVARPTRVRGLPPIARVSTVASHVCAVAVAGGVWCWGQSHAGQLGVPEDALPGCGRADCSRIPLQSRVLGPFEDVFASTRATCVRRDEGGLECWGEDAAVDALPAETRGVALLDFGLQHGCFLDEVGGTVRCFGEATFGRLGNGGAAEGVPVPIDAVVAMEVGTDHACALDAAGVVRCWGSDWAGALGRPKEEVPYCTADGVGEDCSTEPRRP